MGYSIEDIKALTQRWLAGKTTLAEEKALRDFFGGVSGELPEDLQPYRSLFGQIAEAAGERSRRKLVLHTESTTQLCDQKQGDAMHKPLIVKRLSRWITATAGAAAAAVLAVAFFIAPESSYEDEIICMVNGVQITDPQLIENYTREALGMVSDNLRKPEAAISSTLDGTGALQRAAEVLGAITIDTEN